MARSSKIAFITGIAGQDGSYLAKWLLSKGYRVIGLSASREASHVSRLTELGVGNLVKVHFGSVTDPQLIRRLLCRYRPREYYNLAGQSSVGQSWIDPVGTMEVNAGAVLTALQTIAECSPTTRFFQASSAEMYGCVRGVITEKIDRFNPLNPYGVAKLAAHKAVEFYRQERGLFAVSGILCNHESPLRAAYTVTKKIARGVARIAAGLETTITLGNLAIERDWSYAGDVVRAMWLMLQRKTPNDYVIASGSTGSIAEFARAAFRHVGINDWRRYVRLDSALRRQADIPVMRASAKRALAELGWQPTLVLPEIVALMVDYERQLLSGSDLV